MRSILALATMAVLCAAPLSAQTNLTPAVDSARVSATNDSVAAAPLSVEHAAPAGASVTGLRAAVHKAETNRALQPTIAASRGNLGQAKAMMVVGVAAFVAGALIEGDAGKVFMVGGAVIGLLGLYEYLQ